MTSGLRIRAFTVPKFGNLDVENEDAFAISHDERVIAVADGSTEGPFSREWAHALATRFTSEGVEAATVIAQSRPEFAAWVRSVQGAWVTTPRRSTSSAPWYVDRARELGGFATLVALVLNDDSGDKFSWNAVVCGDSCVFQFREGQLSLMVPAYEEGDFLRSPLLISSNGVRDGEALDAAIFASGRIGAGERLILATDAVAAWLTSAVKTTAISESVAALSSGDVPTDEELADLFQYERSEGRLRNDDSTVIVLERIPLATDA